MSEQSPAHHLRDLRVQVGGADSVPDKLFGWIPRFTNMEKMLLFGDGWAASSLRPSLWRLPQSITSLTINTNVFTFVQVWDIMTQLPNLADLSLSGSRASTHESVSPETGKPQRGRFGGRLLLRGGYASKDVMDALLEIPAGLRFTEVAIFCGRDLLLSAVSLVEACSKTLVKLSQSVYFLSKSPPSSWFAGSSA